MLITFERKVPQTSYASQNDHKSKGYPSKTSAAAFTMQKSDKGDLRCLEHPLFEKTFKNAALPIKIVSLLSFPLTAAFYQLLVDMSALFT